MATDNPAFQAQVGALTRRLVDGGLGTYQAERQAYARLYLMVRNQASTLALRWSYGCRIGAICT